MVKYMYLPPNSFRKQDIFNPSARFVITKVTLNYSCNRLFISQMGLIYSPEEGGIPQIRLTKLILRPGQLQNGESTKHGPLVHGPPPWTGSIKIWTGSMDPLSWTGSMDPLFLQVEVAP